MTPEQCKMARAGLGLGVRELSALANVSTPRTLQDIRAALETAGVIFIDANGEGPGVRLRKGMKDV
jgi:hypothetical protein